MREYVRVCGHSDLATEPHLTSAMYGLQNYLMTEPEYMGLYTIEGGIERLTRELARRIRATVLLGHAVTRVERAASGKYAITARHNGETTRPVPNSITSSSRAAEQLDPGDRVGRGGPRPRDVQSPQALRSPRPLPAGQRAVRCTVLAGAACRGLVLHD